MAVSQEQIDKAKAFFNCNVGEAEKVEALRQISILLLAVLQSGGGAFTFELTPDEGALEVKENGTSKGYIELLSTWP